MNEICNILGINEIEQCLDSVITIQSKIYILLFVLILTFIIMQISITALFSKRKGVGFWFGIVGLDIILILAILLFISSIPKLIVYITT